MFLQEAWERITKLDKKYIMRNTFEHTLAVMMAGKLYLIQFDDVQMKNDCLLEM